MLICSFQLRAYPFGHLKSAMSYENSRLSRENAGYQKNTNSENSRVSILRREKCQKNANAESSGVAQRIMPNEREF